MYVIALFPAKAKSGLYHSDPLDESIQLYSMNPAPKGVVLGVLWALCCFLDIKENCLNCLYKKIQMMNEVLTPSIILFIFMSDMYI